MKRVVLLLWSITVYVCTSAQLSTHELPVSFDSKLNMALTSKRLGKTVRMPALDMAKIEKEDLEDEESGFPPRFGYLHKVNLNLKNSGRWTVLPNGDKLWRLNVVCPEALSVNFLYNKFWIPEGGKFFIYSKDKKHSIGAFTSMNNKGDKENVRGFATGLVYGNDVILEYYQPKDVISDAIISIEYVVHGYRYININQSGFGISESCQVDVNCSEGQDWQIEKRGVALIIIEGNKLCTGSLINTTDLSQKPYLLTANHCFDRIGYDAYSNPNLDYSSFYWDYEAPGCNNANTETPTLSTSGATILANDTTSDFALLDLSENPKDLSDYTPYYLGWDRTGESGEAGVCIHHPHGDVKKISTVSSQPRSSNYQILIETVSGTHWGLNWRATTHGHGTTEGGSSGSPLLTADHKIIGQLQGGFSGCSNLNGYDWYGKFDLSWTGNSNINSYRRLNCWLDSLNMGMSRIGGLLAVSHAYTMDTPQQLYGNICINNGGQLFIQDNVEIMGNNQVIVETGGTLVIDGGKLTNANIVMKTGSLLRIINNGIIETQNGFNAPLGTTVEIENGQIE